MSRAYYGAFHLARDFVESCGVTLPKTAKAHDKLQWCLAQSGRIQLPPVAERLNSLRAARNVADYDLTSWWFSKRGSVLVAIRRSLAKTETWRQGSSIQSPKPKTGSDPSKGLTPATPAKGLTPKTENRV